MHNLSVLLLLLCFLATACTEPSYQSPEPGTNNINDDAGHLDDEVDDQCGPGTELVRTDPQCDPDLEECEEVCRDLDAPPPEPEPRPFKFVLIENQTDYDSGGYPAVDLDAVTLTKLNGEVHYGGELFNWESSEEYEGSSPENILGPPDSTSNNCDPAAGTFFSLGMEGWVTLDFDDDGTFPDIDPGDTIEVADFAQECGTWPNENHYTVSLSDDTVDFEGTWLTICEGYGTTTCTVP